MPAPANRSPGVKAPSKSSKTTNSRVSPATSSPRTVTRDKLARDGVRNQSQAIQTHEQVGKEVRDAIKRIGGTLPENIPPAEHIKEVEKRVRAATPKLKLDDLEAGGLQGDAGKKTGAD